MSIQSEITRISGNISSSLTKVASKGVTVPSGSNSDDLPDLIDLITVDPTYTITKSLTNVTSSADDTKVIAGNSFFTELTPASGYYISSITVTMGGVDITDQVFKPGTGAKIITVNGTYAASADNLGGYTAVTVNVPTGGSTLGTKTVTQNGTYYASNDNLDGYSQVSVNVQGGITPAGTKNISITSNGTTTEDVTNYASASITANVPNTYTSSDEGKVVSNGALVSQTSSSVTQNGTVDTTLINSLTVNVSGGGTTKNVQVYSGYDETNATDYTATDLSITVSKSGTYKCSWTGLRNTTSGTSGTRLYKNDSAVGSAHTSGWIRSYYQYATETLSLSKNDVLTVYARARASNYYMVVGNLIIEEQ